MAAKWDSNHLACVNTWAFLRGLGELTASFANAKDFRMSSLGFWNRASGPNMRVQEAKALAGRLDRIYVRALFARYEDGFSYAKAVGDLTTALMVATRKLPSLAEKVDKIYRFRGEVL